MTATFAVTALVARRLLLPDRPRFSGGAMFGWVALYGTLAVVTAITLAGIGLYAGLGYEPPRLSTERVAGTWSDGKGGTLILTSDGKATATRVETFDLDDSFDTVVQKCSGAGTWEYDPGAGPWSQEVDLSVDDCSMDTWSVFGTPSTRNCSSASATPTAGISTSCNAATGAYLFGSRRASLCRDTTDTLSAVSRHAVGAEPAVELRSELKTGDSSQHRLTFREVRLGVGPEVGPQGPSIAPAQTRDVCSGAGSHGGHAASVSLKSVSGEARSTVRSPASIHAGSTGTPTTCSFHWRKGLRAQGTHVGGDAALPPVALHSIQRAVEQLWAGTASRPRGPGEIDRDSTPMVGRPLLPGPRAAPWG